MENRIALCQFRKITKKAYQAKNRKQYETAINYFNEALNISRIPYTEKNTVRTQIQECRKVWDYQSAVQKQTAGLYEEAIILYNKILDNITITEEEKNLINQEIKECEGAIIPEIEMVYVEGGTFQMGSNEGDDDEKPVHTVTLDGFYIGKYEVTQKQWRAVMGSNPSYFSGCDNCPVENVYWADVQEFIRKLNQLTGKQYRLPTEAQWEFAARGGNKSRGYTFAGTSNEKELF
ncbi:MAG: formylglycine-generating enzyme family protein, partial [Bacteroidales bacterium]|nr:formylglycine-generating enzyme family protein [Bacteroidales bacterium]